MNQVLTAFVNGLIVSAVLTVAVWATLGLVSRRSLNASTRYVIWWAMLAVAVSIPLLFLPAPEAPVTTDASVIAAPPVQIRESAAAVQSRNSSFAPISPPGTERFPIQIMAEGWPQWFVGLWLLASAFMLVRLIVSFVILERRKKRAVTLMTNYVRGVRLAASAEIRTPIAAGPYRRSILIPQGMCEELDQTELDQIGLHESAHFARCDDYALILQRIIQASFVFHPIVHWIVRRIDLEREIACDDVVVEATGQPRSYAMCLTRVVELAGKACASPLAASAAEARSDLERRVDMLLDDTRKTSTHLLKGRLAVVIGALAAVTWTLSGFPNVFLFAAPPRQIVEAPVPVAPPAPPILAMAPPAEPKPAPPSTPRPRPEPASIGAPVQAEGPMVYLSVLVLDPQNRYVTGLENQHFTLFEDGVEQGISYFSGGTDTLSYGLVVLGSVAFDTPLSARRPEMVSRSLQTAPLREIVLRLIERSPTWRNGQKAILIVSDGTGSFPRSTLDEIRAALSASDLLISAVTVAESSPAAVSSPDEISGSELLDQITDGRHQTVASSANLPDAANKAFIALSNHYVLGFRSKKPADATFRRLSVKLLTPVGLPALSVIHRQGYQSR